MNSDVNPEVEVSNRVAALMGATLTEADVHRFLLDTAAILGTESFAVYGPDLFFRWRIGERIVEIEPDYRPLKDEYELTVDSYNPTYPIDTDEYQSFKWGEAEDYPYLWTVELGKAPVSDWGPERPTSSTGTCSRRPRRRPSVACPMTWPSCRRSGAALSPSVGTWGNPGSAWSPSPARSMV